VGTQNSTWEKKRKGIPARWLTWGEEGGKTDDEKKREVKEKRRGATGSNGENIKLAKKPNATTAQKKIRLTHQTKMRMEKKKTRTGPGITGPTKAKNFQEKKQHTHQSGSGETGDPRGGEEWGEKKKTGWGKKKTEGGGKSNWRGWEKSGRRQGMISARGRGGELRQGPRRTVKGKLTQQKKKGGGATLRY